MKSPLINDVIYDPDGTRDELHPYEPLGENVSDGFCRRCGRDSRHEIHLAATNMPPLTEDGWLRMNATLNRLAANWATSGAPEEAVVDIRITTVIRLTLYVNQLRERLKDCGG
jgi:hypothetical protein